MKLKKLLSIVLCLVFTLCILSGCDIGATGSVSTDSSSKTSSGQTLGGFGQKFVLSSPSGQFYYGNEFDFTWKGTKTGETVSIVLEKKSGNTYTKLLEKTGLTGNELKTGIKTENTTYRVKITATAADGTVREATNTKDDGLEITVVPLVKNEEVNKGRNFTFDGSISFEVLNNYLDRACTYDFYTPDSSGEFDVDKMNESLRAILNMGVKYVNRTASAWISSPSEEKNYPDMQVWMEFAHSYDPEIIFEACIFETCFKGMNSITIPDWVFEAFGKETESRTFDYNKMLFDDRYGYNEWGEDVHVPDITKEETQMWYYYKACKYINMGYESLHFGQVDMVGKNDVGNKGFTKVVNMIREYAKKNARRHYVLINGHNPTQRLISYTDGRMLFDFNAFVLRLKVKPGSVDHAVSEDNPQECIIEPDGYAAYKRGIKGTSPSGWTTDNYPYLIEFDNWGGLTGDNTKAESYWGYDEISWYANQPQWYRHYWLKYAVTTIKSFKDNGHLTLPGHRTAYLISEGKQTMYRCNDKKYCANGQGDEQAYIEVYKLQK